MTVMSLNMSAAGYGGGWLSNYFKCSWDVASGCVVFDVKYFQDWGAQPSSDKASRHEGFVTDVKPLVITYDGITITINENYYGTGYVFDTGGTGRTVTPSKYTTSETYKDELGNVRTGTSYWVKISIPISQAQIGTQIEYTAIGTWWRNGTLAADADVSFTNVKTPTLTADISDFTISSKVYGESGASPSSPSYNIGWTRGTGNNADGLGSIYLRDNAGNNIASVDNTSTSTFYYLMNADKLNQSENLKLVQEYVPTANPNIKYTKESGSFERPAYPQVSSFTGSFESTTKKITLNWKLDNAPSSDYVNDKFVISCTKANGDVVADKTVSYTGGKTDYSTTYDVPIGEETTYFFSINRENVKSLGPWVTNFAKRDTVAISTKHYAVTSASDSLASNRKNIVVMWKYEGSMYTNGTKFTIKKDNTTTNSFTTIQLTADEFKSGVYVDTTLTSCNAYRYTVSVEPGSNLYTSSSMTTGQLLLVEIGHLLSVDASKGYYSDRTHLVWKTNGKFEKFYINRKIYGSADEYEQIDTKDGSDTQDVYTYDDTHSIPGVVYQYQIAGYVKCNNETKEGEEKPVTVGFRTPTGDVYGRVTYSSGQAVEGVEVRAEESEGDAYMNKDYTFASGNTLTVSNKSILKTSTDSASVQAWVKVTKDGNVVSKSDMYTLAIESGKPTFIVGTQKVTADYAAVTGSFVHLTGVVTGDSVKIYVNGSLVTQVKKDASVTGNDNALTFGGNGFEGNIDEVRLWNYPLSSADIVRDYGRYLTGGEKGLLGYYTFNYSVDKEFYDTSYSGSKYNENHGTVNGATLSSASGDVPTREQLSLKGITATDGSYAIRAIPYTGNGTTYMIIPRKGNHAFQSEKELRLISVNSQSHTVNFTDKSSFNVTGKVTYLYGDIPVEGVSFNIDGVTSMDDKSNIIKTDAKGMFSISVPVGTHEVKAVLANHTFQNGGKITNSDGSDRNYQDHIQNVQLVDNTTVRYIGRLAGGTIQEAYTIGHSLSKNNLGDSIKVKLIYQNESYKIALKDSMVTKTHFLPSNWKRDGKSAMTNQVKYSQSTITIYPNLTTGEFIADVIPVTFKAVIEAPGYESQLARLGGDVNLSQALIQSPSPYSYTDSVNVNKNNANATPKWVKYSYKDTVFYNKEQIFTVRTAPVISVKELLNGEELSYFGSKTTNISGKNGTEKLALYDTVKGYTLGVPVFNQAQKYTLRASVYEGYPYCDGSGKPKTGGETDKVPSKDAIVSFIAEMNSSTPVSVDADSTGVAEYEFLCGEPEFTSATRAITVSAKCGKEGTSFSWDGNNALSKCIVLGAHIKGNTFVTNGPTTLLTILRDPPGSNSYSYLEKGTTFTENSTYTGNVEETGNETWVTDVGTELVTFVGTGAGTINSATVSSGVEIGITQDVSIGGVNSWTTTTTTDTRFQTSDASDFVGADGDVYVGYSTNITYGASVAMNLVSRERYEAITAMYPSYYKVYTALTPTTSDVILVQQDAINIAKSFGTLFAYPQVFIENTLLPNIEIMKKSLLRLNNEKTDQQFQDEAQSTNRVLYVSKLAIDDKNYGKSNSDSIFKSKPGFNTTDGPSYKIYFPSGSQAKDTIEVLNNSIANWKMWLAQNEKEKVEAKVAQNYSFHGGSPIEYSEGYETDTVKTTSFSILVGGTIANDFKVGAAGSKTKFKFEEQLTTQHGGDFTNEKGASNTQGFVLADDGTNDYITVDVCKVEKKNRNDSIAHPSFIFRTQAGSTSCPYEGEYKTKYYNPGQTIDVATTQIEVPQIAAAKDFIENVPSGQSANFTLYLRNNSESHEEGSFVLRVVDGTNPSGAKVYMDGMPIGNGRRISVPADETLTKTLEVSKGAVMNYDNLQLVLESECQSEISDTVSLSAHFTASATPVTIKTPSNNWTYNTKLPTADVNGLKKHYMETVMNGFDVNYDNFYRIMLQYKPSASSDDNWTTLMSYYNDSTLYKQAVANGNSAKMIDAKDAGTISYRWFLDDLQDQKYDLRAVGTSMINNQEVLNPSEVRTGIKDMYNPRLFGSALPANGILTINDEIRLNFNEPIADGYLTDNNFEITGVLNGTKGDHSVSVQLDGENDELSSEFTRNWSNKDVTVEMWVNAPAAQDAVYFSQGSVNEALEFGITSDNHLKVKVGTKTYTSSTAVPFAKDDWAHVAMVYNKDGHASAYYNFVEYINNISTDTYTGEGNYLFGASVGGSGHFKGKMQNARIWDKLLTAGRLQTNSLTLLSGSESNLMAYYPMNEVRGTVLTDKASGVNLTMQGCEWSLPEGRAAKFDGATQYVRLNTGSSAVVDASMDYTMEFWFKAEPGQENATMIANGRGDSLDMGGSRNLLSIGFENKELTFRNNGVTQIVDGSYLDNNWHHFALAVSRTNGRAQIYVDGNLRTYFGAQNLGGISAAYMYVGARGWTPDSSATTVNIDNYFKGEIDEFRIWDLYKSEKLISSNNIERLDGTEKGLLAYYPFEHYITWQGTKELQFTLADQKVPANVANTIPDGIAHGGSVETSASAPVRDKGPITKISNYDFVVNNDALIITLKDSWETLEKTTITFTVDGVRDMNGNELLSPITWSAYIDRNQVKWGENTISISKDANVEETFTVKAVNSGGSVQHFSIENLPSWLTASPSSGTIDPSSSVDITFTIDASLNIGSYDEVIYLRDDNNVVEGLNLQVKVNGEKPDWTVNPAEYRYNMSVFGKLLVNNIYSSDKEDLLAAFYKGKCVGVTNNTYSKVNDMYYALLTVYSNTVTADDLEFRIWDASTGNTYQAVPGENIRFVSDTIFGTSAKPIVFTAKDLRIEHIALNAGWNWVSFNVNNAKLNDLNTTLANSTWTADDIVKHEQTGKQASYVVGTGWKSDSLTIDNLSMFLIKSSDAKTLDVAGSNVDVKTVLIPIIGSKADGTPMWNYISYLPQVNLPLKEALAGYAATEGDIVKSQTGFAMYSGNLGWIGSLTYMESGKGYMLKRVATSAATLQYPSVSATSSSGAKAMTRAVETTEQEFANTDYAGNMTIVAKVSGADVQAGDVLAAYVGGERRGQTKALLDESTGRYLFFIPIAGDTRDDVNFTIERDGKPTASAYKVTTYTSNKALGSLGEPMVIDFSAYTGSATVYPSPFHDVLHIRKQVSVDAAVNVFVTNLQGERMIAFDNCNDSGVVDITWKGVTIPSGVYLVTITVDGHSDTYKVIKK
jgi:hypothetical protein